MATKKNISLFKDRITKSSRKEMARELITAIDTGSNAVHKLLFGSTDIDEYSNHGNYKKGMHDYCSKLSGDSFTEKRLCRCMYYKNSNHGTECEACGYRDRFKVIGDYQIIDYEVPAFYYGDEIGEIDLVISDGADYYATEVKPYKNNKETLLRMIAEIMTYTDGYKEGVYKKAIAFLKRIVTMGALPHNRENMMKKNLKPVN